MLRSRLLSVSALTAAALALGACTTAPYGSSGILNPYNPYPGYQNSTTPTPITASNYQGRGQVVNVQTYQGGTSGTTQGAGALIGGLAGGAIGNQIARRNDNDRTVATVAGAVVGALIGNAIQQQGIIGGNYAGQPIYRVTVRALDNNNLYNFDYPQNPNVQIGEYVQIQGNQLYRLQF